ncbi:hypothetical protein DLH72_04715 [Candidatus Gracilibacteria bacterium]|nr:MAG: hypothetical protein DLH72_04715 [Candidatus Gracilibacteria bacterium]
MYEIIYSDESKEDLLEITTYFILEYSKEIGEKILDKIIFNISKLEIFPYRIVKSSKIFGARELKIPKFSYKVYVKIEEDLKIIKILRILHTSKKFP